VPYGLEKATVASVRTPREQWIDAGLRAVATGGPDAVRIEVLARDLGVTKGGFYWHFTDRAALLGELLEAWEQRGVDEVIAVVEREGGDGRTRLLRLFVLTRSSADVLPLELAIREWARRDKKVATRLRRVDNRRIEYLRSLFRDFCEDEGDVEARSMLVMALFVGEPLVAATHGRLDRADVLRLIGERLLA
jgi:AcrR family transcriptional regulator